MPPYQPFAIAVRPARLVEKGSFLSVDCGCFTLPPSDTTNSGLLPLLAGIVRSSACPKPKDPKTVEADEEDGGKDPMARGNIGLP